MLGFEIQASL